MIREIVASDSEQICNIYNYYIENTIITFEEKTISVSDMQERIQSSKLPWLVVEENDKVLGYAFASEWKARCAYRFSVEVSIYLDHKKTGKKIGKPLYKELISPLHYLIFSAVYQ